MVLPDGGGLEMDAPALRGGVSAGVLCAGREPGEQNTGDRQNECSVHEHGFASGRTSRPSIDCDRQMSKTDDRTSRPLSRQLAPRRQRFDGIQEIDCQDGSIAPMLAG